MRKIDLKQNKMYERIEFIQEAKNGGNEKFKNLIFPSESSNPNASTYRSSKEDPMKRLSNKLKI